MEQPLSLRELLKLCTVRLLVRGQSQGTGFFVASGLILTCAHVVQTAWESKLPVEVYTWDGQSLGQGSIERYMLDVIPVKDTILDKITNLYPDLALLHVTLTEHPCAYLDNKVSYHDALFSYGYPQSYSSGDGAEFTYEDESWIDNQRPLLKFREGQAQEGLSGAPLLNLKTGGVCGVIQKTRGSKSDIGGRAIPTSIVLQKLPELVIPHQQSHQQNNRWVESLTPQQRQALGLVISSPILDPTEPIEVFYSYADTDKDKAMLEDLLKHLSVLKRRNFITNWYPGVVVPGEEPTEQVIKHLNSARIILLLISPDYVSSDDLASIQVKRAMERHDAKEASVIPILLRSIDNWKEEPFGRLQAIPRNGKPVSKWSDSDEAFAEVTKEIRGVVTNLRNATPWSSD